MEQPSSNKVSPSPGNISNIQEETNENLIEMNSNDNLRHDAMDEYEEAKTKEPNGERSEGPNGERPEGPNVSILPPIDKKQESKADPGTFLNSLQNESSGMEKFSKGKKSKKTSKRVQYKAKKMKEAEPQIASKTLISKKTASKGSHFMKKRIVDIEEMLNDEESDAESEIAMPKSGFNIQNDNIERDESRDKVAPLIPSAPLAPPSPRNKKQKSSKKRRVQQQPTLDFNSQSSNNSIGLNLRANSNSNEGLKIRGLFSNVTDKVHEREAKASGYVRPKVAPDLFRRGGDEQIQKMQADQKDFDSLKFGSSITLNLQHEGDQVKKFTTKYRITEKLVASKAMHRDEYDINNVFAIIPSAQYVMQDKIIKIVGTQNPTMENIEIDFENFKSEMNSNSKVQQESIGRELKYGDSFQLYQDSSKRFLCFDTAKIEDIKKAFKKGYTDSHCYYLSFSEYPGDNTHFSFKTIASFQQGEDGVIKKHHHLYLTAYEKGKKHYLYNTDKALLLTETYKSPLTITIIREKSGENEKRTVARTDVTLISYANDNFYLNVPQEMNYETGKYEQKPVVFERWKDTKNIDFNGWWIIENDDENNCCSFKNYNSGKYLMNDSNGEGSPFKLTDEAEEAARFDLEPISFHTNDIMAFHEDVIFKIKQHAEGPLPTTKAYVRIESKEDNNNNFFYQDETASRKKIVIRNPCPVNQYDTFKMLFPKQDEYLELSLCIDSREYIRSFTTKLMKSDDVLGTLSSLKEVIAQVFLKILEFIQNKLKGKIRAEFAIGEVIPHRQEMVAKVGILNSIFRLLEDTHKAINGRFEFEDVLDKLTISSDDFGGYSNLLEILIQTIHVCILKNPENLAQCIQQMNIIQNFVFVENCPTLLIDTFKDKNFELNKKEIHVEMIYRRIFEIRRFEPVLDHFVEKLKDD